MSVQKKKDGTVSLSFTAETPEDALSRLKKVGESLQRSMEKKSERL